jgi:hypothetical protein
MTKLNSASSKRPPAKAARATEHGFWRLALDVARQSRRYAALPSRWPDNAKAKQRVRWPCGENPRPTLRGLRVGRLADLKFGHYMRAESTDRGACGEEAKSWHESQRYTPNAALEINSR